MTLDRRYFFCGIGGSGMLPLAMIVAGRGAHIAGSDRARDQGRNPEKFAYLTAHGAALFPQDGSGVTDPATTVVVSTAVEASVPDVAAAHRIGAPIETRAQLLAHLFNSAKAPIGIAGTSGKSTTTGMLGWILSATGRDPTIMNGAVMKNFVRSDAPFASARVGKGETFVSEVDESDGSIALYRPQIAVLNNIAHDHKSMDELRVLFRDFLAKAATAVVNCDNEEAAALMGANAVGFSLADVDAALYGFDLQPAQDGIAFAVREGGQTVRLKLNVPGRHNVANGLAALGAARAVGVPLGEAAEALEGFAGVKRRMELVGTAGGITVYDDFAHNPDKIAATLSTLHDFPGRLLICFQPHGFGPLKLMRDGFIDVFARMLSPDDVLVMPEPVYFGGTVDRSVSSGEIVAGIAATGRHATAYPTREKCGDKLLALAKPGDRIVVMGARDDTLSTFAASLLAELG
ncbi:glutamate ligase domain-containing protein [Rhizomicrobium electricum]|uniref:UDP-N-acetylmuramate--L-alanine ligase n=1 Tax=Rhizomicrobium electricum TaxID=480070 RepID=A0ABN1EU83_9PROT|nr:Mur ligase family protein [Rhizomicrobium electricum]NIJ49653.1 UDP-N-acetylmuramate--alanine ligase [Rhizomicrobium electricum]